MLTYTEQGLRFAAFLLPATLLPSRAAVVKAVEVFQKETTVTSKQSLAFSCPEHLNSITLPSIFLSDTKQKGGTNPK